jgi:hypothetical protein
VYIPVYTYDIDSVYHVGALPFGFFGFNIKERSALLYDQDAPAHFSTTTMSRVGQAIVGILQHPEETRNRIVYISSFIITNKELIDALERVSGEKWTGTPASTYDLERQGNDRMARGDRYGAYDLVVAALFRRGHGSDYALRKNDNELLGLRDENLDDVLKEVLAKAG